MYSSCAACASRTMLFIYFRNNFSLVMSVVYQLRKIYLSKCPGYRLLIVDELQWLHYRSITSSSPVVQVDRRFLHIKTSFTSNAFTALVAMLHTMWKGKQWNTQMILLMNPFLYGVSTAKIHTCAIYSECHSVDSIYTKMVCQGVIDFPVYTLSWLWCRVGPKSCVVTFALLTSQILTVREFIFWSPESFDPFVANGSVSIFATNNIWK